MSYHTNINESILYIVTLDYKGLVLLMAKINDDDFLLGGQGLAIEFCIFCLALRVSYQPFSYIYEKPTQNENIQTIIEM